MKNKKIIPITVCLVAMVLVGMLCLSKFFETSWQRENTVDNGLTAEINSKKENSAVINYPFVMDNNSIKPEAFSNIISCQEAVNIAGEAILYLSGITEHQKIPGQLSLLKQRRVVVNNSKTADETGTIIKDRYNYIRYSYSLRVDTDLSDEDCPKYIQVNCVVDAEKGEIISILIENYSKYGQDYQKIKDEYMPYVTEKRELTQSEIDRNLDYINQIINAFGWTAEPVSYKMTEQTTPYGKVYNADILLDNGEAYVFMICSEDGIMEKDSLIAVSRYNYEPEDMIPIG